MKGWTLEALESKGVKFAVTGGASAPAVAPVKRAAKKQAKREPLRASRSRPAVAEIVLDLPVPPSVNACWANVEGVGRVRSTAYRRWSKLAVQEVQAQRAGRVAGKFSVVITAKRTKRKRDIDNIIKPILDLLSGLITADDSECERVSAGWTEEGDDGVTVSVRAA